MNSCWSGKCIFYIKKQRINWILFENWHGVCDLSPELIWWMILQLIIDCGKPHLDKIWIIIFCPSSYRLYLYCNRNFVTRNVWYFYIIEHWTNLIFSDNKRYKSIVVSFGSCTNYWFYLILMIFVIYKSIKQLKYKIPIEG